MKDTIVLCGQGRQVETAASWARDRARAARRSQRVAIEYGQRVGHAYEEACRVLVTGASESSSIQITLVPSDLSTKIELIDGKLT